MRDNDYANHYADIEERDKRDIQHEAEEHMTELEEDITQAWEDQDEVRASAWDRMNMLEE